MLPNKLSKSRAIKRPAWRAAPPPVSLIIQNMGSFISKDNEWGPPRRGSRPAVGLGSGLGLTQTLPFMYLKGPTKLLLVSPAKWISFPDYGEKALPSRIEGLPRKDQSVSLRHPPSLRGWRRADLSSRESAPSGRKRVSPRPGNDRNN